MRNYWVGAVALLLAGIGAGCAAPPAWQALATDTASNVSTEQAPPRSPAQQTALARMQDQGPAPELTNEVWINSEPLKLADLRGQVVIVEFWTYG